VEVVPHVVRGVHAAHELREGPVGPHLGFRRIVASQKTAAEHIHNLV
jgi:hypothetical protein